MARVVQPVPGGPVADLVLVEPGQALAGVEPLLDRPAEPGDLDQGGQRDVLGRVAAVVALSSRVAGCGASAASGDPGSVGSVATQAQSYQRWPLAPAPAE